MGLLALLWIGTGIVYWLAAPPAVTVVHPLQGPAVQAVYATGTVEPTVMVPISAHSMARLVELNVDEGQTVVKGHVLARLEDDDLRRAVEVTEAEERYTGMRCGCCGGSCCGRAVQKPCKINTVSVLRVHRRERVWTAEARSLNAAPLS
jgi:multidrug efflux pump subunit AcrA (membrane-fusion protein)